MKQLLVLAFLFVGVVAHGGEPKTFSGEITGVVCAACQEHVSSALKKVEGITNVEFKPTNDPSVRHIEITATKPEFSASDANNALAAAKVENYKVTKLAAK